MNIASKNKALQELLDQALVVARDIEAETKTANVDTFHIREAVGVANLRAKHLARSGQKEEEPVTRESALKHFSALKPAELAKAKAHFAGELKQQPENAAAKLALEVITELEAKK